jgi:hypothetical protein
MGAYRTSSINIVHIKLKQFIYNSGDSMVGTKRISAIENYRLGKGFPH